MSTTWPSFPERAEVAGAHKTMPNAAAPVATEATPILGNRLVIRSFRAYPGGRSYHHPIVYAPEVQALKPFVIASK
jgi:hypothetical protein